MKKIFVMAALSLAAISCTKSDVLDSPVMDQKISFNTYLGRAPQVKAAVIDNTNIKDHGLKVVALKNVKGSDENTYSTDYNSLYINDNLTWEKTVVDGTETYSWSCSKDYYWPIDESPLTFGAYGLNAKDYISEIATNNVSFKYTVPAEIGKQQDLVVAESSTNNTGVVPLNLNHVLSRIGFQVSSDQKITINNLSLAGKFVKEAEIKLIPATDEKYLNLYTQTEEYQDGYSVVSSSSSVSFNATSAAVPVLADNYLMIIPQNVTSDMKIVGQYQVGDDNSTKNFEITLKEFDTNKILHAFESGKAYEFVLNVTSAKIQFSVEVNDWSAAQNYNQAI